MAVNAKVEKDRKKLRELERKAAIEMIGKALYDNLFESIEGEDFENGLNRRREPSHDPGFSFWH